MTHDVSRGAARHCGAALRCCIGGTAEGAPGARQAAPQAQNGTSQRQGQGAMQSRRGCAA